MTPIFREEIFSPSFPLDGPHLVAASAGTGKTHNIQNVCARLVMERGLRVSDITVTTFTKAATKELRDRVRGVFANLLRFYGGDTAGMRPEEIERLEKLRECARKKSVDDATAKARVELALQEFDRASVSTIHGFCERALVRFAFETRGAFRTEIGGDASAELGRRARDWWRVNRPGFPLAELVAAAKGLGGKSDWKLDKDPATGEDDPCLAAAAEVVRGYDRDRPLRETQTFQDLLRAVRDALDDPVRGADFARKLRGEFKAVVVDEFQDTDPVQYGIFREAFIDVPPGEDRPPVFFVGDPKQAIYAFRGCDIHTYGAAAKSRELAGSTYRLDRNFRSTPKLVDAVNRMFGDPKNPDGSVAARTFSDEAIPYDEDVEPTEEAGSRIAGLSVGTPDGGTVEDPRPFRIVRAENKDARNAAVVDAVLEILAEQGGKPIKIKDTVEPFGPKHVAVLVFANDDAREFRRMLRERGVPAVFEKSGNVFAGETAREFRLVLLAMADGGDRGLIRAALATSFFDFPVGELEKEDSAAFADKVGFFASLHRKWTKRGFNAAFAELEDGCGLRARFAAMPDGERRLADLFQILDLAGAAVRERGPSPETLVDWITERINLSGEDAAEEDADEYARELESDADAVRIMTVHGAKGLEFPVTVVPVQSKAQKPRFPFFRHDEAGNLFAGRDEEAAAAEAAEEKTRLLYVAFTRATRRTIVVAPETAIDAFENLLGNAVRPRPGDPDGSPFLFSVYDPPVPPRPDYQPAPDAGTVADAETPGNYGPFLAKRKGSYSSLAPSKKARNGDDGTGEENETGSFSDSAADANDSLGRNSDGGDAGSEPSGGDADHPIFDIGGGAKTGTCWHDILERLPFDASPEKILEATAKAMRLHGLSRGDPKEVEERVKTVSEMIRKTLDWTLASPTGKTFSLRDVPTEKRFSEWEFDFSSAAAEDRTPAIAEILRDEWKGDPKKERFLQAVENWDRKIPKGFFVGFLDLLFEHDGFWYVVDWKSNKIGGKKKNFSEAGVREEMAVEGYFFQYLLYSAVLHRFLKETMGGAYSWERHFGGVRYYFLRGIAAGGTAPVFEDRPARKLLDALCEALGLEDR